MQAIFQSCIAGAGVKALFCQVRAGARPMSPTPASTQNDTYKNLSKKITSHTDKNVYPVLFCQVGAREP